MYLTPAHMLLLNRMRPNVTLLDVRDDITDLTTYTFTAVNIGYLGSSSYPAQTNFDTLPVIRSPNNKAIAISVHSRAAAITWTVTSCTIGGVAGVKVIDRGGGGSAINTAQFCWAASDLQGIANTDVVVTFSKAITACAIGVLAIEGFRFIRTAGVGNSSSVGTGAVAIGGQTTTTNMTLPQVMGLMATTNITGAGGENPIIDPTIAGGGDGGSMPPMLLYSGFNAEINYAGAWSYSTGIGLQALTTGFFPGFRVDWSGAGAFDCTCFSIV